MVVVGKGWSLFSYDFEVKKFESLSEFYVKISKTSPGD